MNVNSLNKVMIIGRLGKDPDVRYTTNGDAVADISIATSEKFKKGDDYQEKTEWHKCVIWGQKAEFAKTYLKKGQLIYVEGKLQTRKWQDKDGNNRYSTEVQVFTLTTLGKSEFSQPTSQPNQPTSQSGEDDIPF